MSLCTTAHPLHTRFTKIIGTSISETTIRPDPMSQGTAACYAGKYGKLDAVRAACAAMFGPDAAPRLVCRCPVSKRFGVTCVDALCLKDLGCPRPTPGRRRGAVLCCRKFFRLRGAPPATAHMVMVVPADDTIQPIAPSSHCAVLLYLLHCTLRLRGPPRPFIEDGGTNMMTCGPL